MADAVEHDPEPAEEANEEASGRAIPRYLSVGSRRWLRHLAEGYGFSETEWSLAVLAAETRDRASTARRKLEREGLTIAQPILSRKGEHVGDRIIAHPAAVIAKDATALYSRLVGQLGLDAEGAS
jgi:hypothetical protein